MVNIRRGWTIPARPEEADREERRQRRLLDTEFRRWRERAPQPSPKPEEEGPVQLAQTQGMLNLRAPTIGPEPRRAPPPPDPLRELAEAFAPPPSRAFGEAPLSAFGQLEEQRVQRGGEEAQQFFESIQGRDLREVAQLMGLAEVARQRGVTPQQLLAEPGETDFEITNLQREVQLASRPFLEQLAPSGDPLAVGKRFGLGVLQMAQEAEALERRTLRPVTRPVGRAVTQAATEAVVPQVPRPLRALGVPDFPGREAFREQAGEVGETVGEFGLVPSNLLPIPIADDILRILAKGVPIAARLLTRAGRQATREELKQLAEGAVRFITRTPPTDPAERALAEQAVEPLTRAAAAEEVAPVVAREAAPPARVAGEVAEGAPSIQADMLRAGRESTADIRSRVSDVRLGPIEGNEETILFGLDGKPHKGVLRGRNRDVVPGLSEEADRSIAVRTLLDGDATPVGGPVAEAVGPPRLETLADDAARLADEGLPPVGGGAAIGLPSPRTLKTVEEIAQDARRSTQNAFGALTRGAARFGPTRTLADFINPSALIDAPPANLVNEIGEEAASQLQANLVAHARQMDQGSAIAAAIEEGVQTRARAVGLEVEDGLVVSVKGSPPVGDLFENPSRYALTPDQRQLVDEVQTVLNDMNAVEKAAGVKKGLIFSEEGRYFPRLVREVRGVENVRAQVRRMVGVKQGFAKERFYETMQEGMDAGVRYEDDIGAIVGTRIRAGMKATGDESLGQLIRPLGRTLKAPRAGVAIGETGTMVPALGGRAFPTETGRRIMDALSPAPPGSTLRFTDALNNVLRPIQATGELSFWGIQMLGSIFRNPVAFAKGAAMSLDGLLLDGRMYGRYIQNNSDWINRFVRSNGVWNSSEFTFDQAVRNKTIRNVFERTGVKGALGRFDQAFNQGLNVTALENFKGMVGLGDSVGFEKFNRTIRAALGDFAGETTDEVAASVASKMTGRLPVRGLGVKATQRSVESTLAFAPRYYRAMFGLLGDAIQGGMRGAEAKRVLGSLFAGALATHVAVAHGLGQEPNLDPRNSNFLTVRVGKTKMGVGGPIYGLGRMIAESVENPDKLRSVNMDNPLVRWARGRAAPVLSLAIDLVTQETFMGEKIDSPGDLFREIATTPLPFIAQQTIEEGPEGFPPQFFGLRAFPAGARERFEDLYQEKYGTAPQPDISPRQLDPELAEQAGYDPARETEFGAERAGITAGEEGRLADLSRIVLTGQPEAMEQFEEELGDFFRFRSGVTETLVRNLGLPEREASLVQDFYDLDPRDRRDPETGKPDWDHFESQRDRILSSLRREGPSGREAASALERGTGISFPDPDLQRVYDARQSLREGLDAYYDTDSKKREAYRRRNPGVDAKLYLLGRVSRVVTSAAQREVRSLSRRLLGTEVEAGRGERRERRFGEPIRIGPIEPIAIGR